MALAVGVCQNNTDSRALRFGVLVWCGFWIRRLRIFRREPDTWKAGDYEHDLWRDVREPAGMAIRCPPGIRCHGSVIQGILPQAREKLESDYRIELEERVGGSRERPRAIRAHEWTQGDVKMSILKINKYNTGKRCADCKHFHMAQNISESECDLRSATGTFRKYPFHPIPSHVNCHNLTARKRKGGWQRGRTSGKFSTE